MANFEVKNLSDILENNTLINSLHEKMEKRKARYQPNPKDFIGEPGYNEEEINVELRRVAEYKRRWNEENSDELKKQKKISDILEGIIIDQLSSEWMSQKAEDHTHLHHSEFSVEGHYTSEVDDVLRGVDAVAELKEDDSSQYLGIAIDVTMAKDPSVLDQKLEKNWQNIESGKFTEIKYFEDTEGKKQRLSPVKILIAVNPIFARELIRLEHLNKKELLGNHKFQSHLILQIKEQLEAYYRYAQAVGNDSLMDKLSESLRIFYKIISGEKENEVAELQPEVNKEEDFLRIKNYCDRKIMSALNSMRT